MIPTMRGVKDLVPRKALRCCMSADYNICIPTFLYYLFLSIFFELFCCFEGLFFEVICEKLSFIQPILDSLLLLFSQHSLSTFI